MGAFPPPLPEGADTCYISDHTDIALGMNADTPHPEAARTFLEWMTTQEFAELYANALPGFFPLSDHAIELEDPVAQEFVDWRNTCESTIRNSYQILSRGEPNLENELWRVSAQVMAQPDPTLAERVIAQLSDGTPLVTRKPVEAGQVVGDMLAFWDRYAGAAPAALPSSVSLVTGRSKTADIEGELITGVHGPGEVHILIVERSECAVLGWIENPWGGALT